MTAEQAAADAEAADCVEELAFPNRQLKSLVYYRRGDHERLASLIITELEAGAEKIVAYLPVPTRVGSSSGVPTEVLGRVCLRFGEPFRFARESASLLVRVSATISPAELGSFPTTPFEHEGAVLAPVYLANFVSASSWECRLFFILRVSALQQALTDPEPWKTGRFEHLDLVNGLFALLSDNISCVGNWGFYLFDAQFSAEPELRNKAGTIWLMSLVDSLEAEMRTAADYRSLINEHGLIHLAAAADQIDRFFSYIREVLSLFSREEQIFLRDFRDQLVHSWLARRHAKTIPVKIFVGGELQVERIEQRAFADIVRPFYESGPLDRTVGALLSRALDQRLSYWRAVNELRNALPLLQDSMLLGRTFDIRSLRP